MPRSAIKLPSPSLRQALIVVETCHGHLTQSQGLVIAELSLDGAIGKNRISGQRSYAIAILAGR